MARERELKMANKSDVTYASPRKFAIIIIFCHCNAKLIRSNDRSCDVTRIFESAKRWSVLWPMAIPLEGAADRHPQVNRVSLYASAASRITLRNWPQFKGNSNLSVRSSELHLYVEQHWVCLK